jgi:hypothetical protein
MEIETENWPRIGVVLSIIWILVVSYWVFAHVDNKAVGTAQALYESCASVPHADVAACLRAVVGKDYRMSHEELVRDAFRYWPSFAFGPLVLAWLLIYLFKKLL